MNNVLFLYQDRNMPSSRIRVLNLIPELEDAGIGVVAEEFPRTVPQKIAFFNRLRTFDCIVLQKKLVSGVELALIRALSRKLVFDFDDAIYCRDDTHPSFESRTRLSRFKNVVRKADLVIAGNEILFQSVLPYNRNVAIIPSAVETRGIPVQNHDRHRDPITIGWVGGKGNIHHLAKLAPVLQRLSQEFDLRLVILSNGSLDIDGVKVSYIPWRLETQEEVIAEFDIGVMPLPDNQWTRGKCGYKALQYMASGVPAVVSEVGMNQDIVTNGSEGFAAATIDDFYEPLKTLIINRELRREMGIRARERVVNSYSVSAVGKQLVRTLKELITP